MLNSIIACIFARITNRMSIMYMKRILSIFCLALGVLLVGCSTVALTGRKQLLLISDAEVMSLSNQSYAEYMSTAQRSTHSSNVALVQTVGSRIVGAVQAYFKANGMESALQGYSWEINLVQDPSANAFCMPGGKIVVYEGILPYTRDAAGLAIVLGHEVAHAVANHAQERMSQQMLLSLGGTALSVAMVNKSSTVQMISSQVFGLGSTVALTLPFSRKNETEADEMGLIFAAMAGYDPNAAVDFWQRMSATSGGTPEFLSTHPSHSTRIKNLQKFMPEALKYYQGQGGTSQTQGASQQQGGSSTRVFTPSERTRQ